MIPNTQLHSMVKADITTVSFTALQWPQPETATNLINKTNVIAALTASYHFR